MLETALYMIPEDNEFCMELEMAGTVIYAETFTPYEQELHHVLNDIFVFDISPHTIHGTHMSQCAHLLL